MLVFQRRNADTKLEAVVQTLLTDLPPFLLVNKRLEMLSDNTGGYRRARQWLPGEMVDWLAELVMQALIDSQPPSFDNRPVFSSRQTMSVRHENHPSQFNRQVRQAAYASGRSASAQEHLLSPRTKDLLIGTNITLAHEPILRQAFPPITSQRCPGVCPVALLVMCLYGSGMAFGHSHGNANLPLILTSGARRGLKHGRQIDRNAVGKPDRYTDNFDTPGKHYAICFNPVNSNAHFCNLLLAMALKLDVPVEKIADSNSVVSELL